MELILKDRAKSQFVNVLKMIGTVILDITETNMDFV